MLACVAVAVALQVAFPPGLVALLPSPDMHELHPDFDTFRASAVALVQGGDIYDTPAKLRNLNPPLLAVLLTPFALLDALPAYRLFTVLTLLLVVGAVLVVARELRLTARVTTAVVLVVLASSPLHGTLLLGQIYGLLLVGLVAGWVAERRGHPLLAAALLRRHRGAQAVAGPAAAAPARPAPVAAGRGGVRGGGRGVAARRAGRGPGQRAAVAADRPHRAGARHRRQRLAARPGRAARAAVRGRHAAGPRGARGHAGRAGPVAPRRSTPPAPRRGPCWRRGC